MSHPSTVHAPRKTSAVATYIPGLVLVAVITASAYGLRHLPFLSALSPMISAIFVGMLFANTVGFSSEANAGVGMAGKKLLRLAVALLGLQLTFGQLAGIGVTGLALAVTALSLTFFFTVWMGRVLGIDRKLTLLLAAGTSVCGASAIAGANAVARADDEDVSYAVACITLFGTIAMFVLPLFQAILGLEPHDYGLWIGLSVHEVAQVVGAGFQGGELAGQTAVVAKLARVMMLAPLVVAIAVVAASPADDPSPRRTGIYVLPTFIVGFVLLTMLNSSGLVPEQVRAPIVSLTPVLLTAAMGALGLGTNFSKLRQRGFRPLVLSGLATLFIASVGLGLVSMMS
ncbi:putative integral membrane protein (TIGR00698 family) [Aminobacter lissarensis]|uniref:Integral membrane protein (TIGR00698 family) n=1 Tax=Aminobacter carboxidus TaxID=376165 RepID=A0A8E1WJR5_9HYPH|nr:YeiH family protein [Aminobacter lissarensis]MBB6470326.1 putative integral membrane protein (TIGR00698 family) [Aminobacter lissarensis]